MSYQQQLNKYFDKRYPQYPRDFDIDVWVEGVFEDDLGWCPTCDMGVSAGLRFWYRPEQGSKYDYGAVTYVEEDIDTFPEILKGILEA